jgi:hypothetical protein
VLAHHPLVLGQRVHGRGQLLDRGRDVRLEKREVDRFGRALGERERRADDVADLVVDVRRDGRLHGRATHSSYAVCPL